MLYECAKEALGEQTVIISRPEFIDRFQENGENEEITVCLFKSGIYTSQWPHALKWLSILIHFIFTVFLKSINKFGTADDNRLFYTTICKY